jgi:hypothetical protein
VAKYVVTQNNIQETVKNINELQAGPLLALAYQTIPPQAHSNVMSQSLLNMASCSLLGPVCIRASFIKALSIFHKDVGLQIISGDLKKRQHVFFKNHQMVQLAVGHIIFLLIYCKMNNND